jgi:hypothetical protein
VRWGDWERTGGRGGAIGRERRAAQGRRRKRTTGGFCRGSGEKNGFTRVREKREGTCRTRASGGTCTAQVDLGSDGAARLAMPCRPAVRRGDNVRDAAVAGPANASS